MAVISTRIHAAGDYATGAGLLAAPSVLRMSDGVAAGVLRGTGAAILGLSALTDYELGIRRWVPMPAHLIADAATGAALGAGAVVLLRRRGGGLATWVPHLAVGVGEVVVAALTARRPGGGGGAEVAPVEAPAEAAGGRGAGTVAEGGLRTAADGGLGTAADGGLGMAADAGSPSADAASPDDAAARAEVRARALADDSIDPLVAREESAAAASAGRIGGLGSEPAGDPAMDPVYEAGGGEQDGWEEAEALLVENASHGDGGADPERDAFTPEVETDRSTAAYGEPDSIRSTEVPEERAGDAQENPPGGPDAPA